MSADLVGKSVAYQYAKGKFVPAVVVEYVPDKPQGDYRLGGFTNSEQKAAGGGDVFNVFSVLGTTQGSFKL